MKHGVDSIILWGFSSSCDVGVGIKFRDVLNNNLLLYIEEMMPNAKHKSKIVTGRLKNQSTYRKHRGSCLKPNST